MSHLTDIVDCIGWNPPPRLVRALRDRGYDHPWEMPYSQFVRLKDDLTLAEGRAEFDRIARALHADSDLPSAMTQYGQDFAFERPALVARLRGISPEEKVSLYRAVDASDPNPIRPGDWVALERWYAKEHGAAGYERGSSILTKKIPAGDVAWAGTSADEWLYAPALCRDPEGTVHGFLVAYGLAKGYDVPGEVLADYPGMREMWG